MDNADGVEAEFTPQFSLLSPDRSNISPVRRMRKDRLVQQYHRKGEGGGSRTVYNGDESPTFSKQQENAKALADDFDSAWVNLPSSAFFGSPSPSRQQPTAPTAQIDEDDEDEEVGYVNMERTSAEPETFEPQTGYVEQLYVEEEKPRKRGLRGFLKRHSSGKRGSVHTLSSSSGRTIKERSVATELPRRPPPPSRTGSRSLEDEQRNIRNPNLAKKFSRLMRVYEDNGAAR